MSRLVLQRLAARAARLSLVLTAIVGLASVPASATEVVAPPGGKSVESPLLRIGLPWHPTDIAAVGQELWLTRDELGYPVRVDVDGRRLGVVPVAMTRTAVSPDGSRVYGMTPTGVAVIDAATRTQVGTLRWTRGCAVRDLAVSDRAAYVSFICGANSSRVERGVDRLPLAGSDSTVLWRSDADDSVADTVLLDAVGDTVAIRWHGRTPDGPVVQTQVWDDDSSVAPSLAASARSGESSESGDLALSPDGSRLLLGDGRMLSTADLAPASGFQVAPRYVSAVSWSSGGRRALVGGSSGLFSLAPASGAVQAQSEHPDYPNLPPSLVPGTLVAVGDRMIGATAACDDTTRCPAELQETALVTPAQLGITLRSTTTPGGGPATLRLVTPDPSTPVQLQIRPVDTREVQTVALTTDADGVAVHRTSLPRSARVDVRIAAAGVHGDVRFTRPVVVPARVEVDVVKHRDCGNCVAVTHEVFPHRKVTLDTSVQYRRVVDGHVRWTKPDTVGVHTRRNGIAREVEAFQRTGPRHVFRIRARYTGDDRHGRSAWAYSRPFRVVP